MTDYRISGYTKSRKKSDLNKWQVGYKTSDGGYGVLGYLPLFNSYEEAHQAFIREQKDRAYMVEPVIKHPSRLYSGY